MSTRFTVLLAALLLGACSSDVRHSPEKPRPPPEAVRVGTTRGGAVVLSRDERIAVVSNRASGVVSVVELDPEAQVAQIVRKVTPVFIGTGRASEPWAGVIGADDNTAYVITRATRQVYRIVDLRGQPHIDGFVSVGSEPTSIVISPSGERLFVANFGEGTISVVTTNELVETKISLNEALANTGVLGAVSPRPALAHPRALALTDDGDESDDGEVLYATEFFSQPIPGAEDPGDITLPDRNRQGLVYPVPLAHVTRVGTPIPIQPTSTGFYDAATQLLPEDQWRATNCVPNQLYAAVADAGQLFVTAMCASPAGPINPPANGSPIANFKTLVHPAIFVVDTEANQELPQRAVVLTQALTEAYESDAEMKQIRMPLIPNDIEVIPDPGDKAFRKLCVPAMGADAVFCATYDSTGKTIAVGEPRHRFIDLHAQGFRVSRRPTGLALSRKAKVPFGLAVNDGTTDLSVFDLESSIVEDVRPLAADVPRDVDVTGPDANRGRTLFSTGLTAWSLQGQAWSSCESCHPDGLSDGLTWFFSRGPRRTLSTAGTYVGDQRRIMLWTGNIDEVHDVEAITRTVSGGVGGLLWDYPPDFPSPEFRRILYGGETVPAVQNSKPSSLRRDNLNGSIAALINDGLCSPDADQCDSTQSHDWDDIDAFIRTVRSPARPGGLDTDDVIAGEALFASANCSKCHSGPAWTLSRVFYTPGDENNGTLPFAKPTATTSAMVGALRSTRYEVPKELLALNPPGASGSATFRLMPGGMDPLDALYPPASAADQINCVLRDVGTFPAQTAGAPANTSGIAPQGAPVVRELRQDMKTLALGVTGFNIPSLLGLSLGAPYFHAGNARTLEELFDGTFAPHYQAFGKSFEPTPKDVRALVAYLLTIDDDLRVQPTPSPEVHDLCGQHAFP